MTDMPAFYPFELIDGVNQRLAKGQPLHTIVLWTKHARSLFAEPLVLALEGWKKSGIVVSVQLTVTGFGGEEFLNKAGHPVQVEPGVPALADSLSVLPRLVALVGPTDAITIRFDPIMRLSGAGGRFFSNLDQLPKVLAAMKENKLRRMVFSFLEPGVYRKTDRHFSEAGLDIVRFNLDEKRQIALQLAWQSAQSEVKALSCCVEGLPSTACIDGSFLSGLAPHLPPPSLKQPYSRGLCGCTTSVDIGGWPPRLCYSGCLYCYARPLVGKPDQSLKASVDRLKSTK